MSKPHILQVRISGDRQAIDELEVDLIERGYKISRLGNEIAMGACCQMSARGSLGVFVPGAC